jgi:hypothetical protein
MNAMNGGRRKTKHSELSVWAATTPLCALLSEEAKRKATEKAEAIRRALFEVSIEKEKREEQKKVDGKARRAKAEERSQVKRKKR